MRPLYHALGIAAGLAAPVAVTLWSTSAHGPRSNAHYASVAAESASPKDVILAFEKLAFDKRQPAEAVRRYFSETAVDHSSRVAGDKASVIALLEKLDWSTRGPTRTVLHVLSEGDMVAVHYHLVREAGTKGEMAVDLFRVANGKIEEHWEVLQPLP
jgi:predicted SnoaL-like aldol condensation-catalyzing enzyme